MTVELWSVLAGMGGILLGAVFLAFLIPWLDRKFP